MAFTACGTWFAYVRCIIVRIRQVIAIIAIVALVVRRGGTVIAIRRTVRGVLLASNAASWIGVVKIIARIAIITIFVSFIFGVTAAVIRGAIWGSFYALLQRLVDMEKKQHHQHGEL